jgi:hypothetical protein
MTVIPLPRAGQIDTGTDADVHPIGRAEPRRYASNAAGLVHDATTPLLRALEDAVSSAAAEGTNDTGARTMANLLRDAHIALHLAITAAGTALADREIRIGRAS